MSIPIACPDCGREWSIGENVLGRQIQCPRCEVTFLAKESHRGEQIVSELEMAAPDPRPSAGEDRRRVRYPEDDEDYNRFRSSGDGGVSSVIPYNNGLALAAYYCGVFGLIPGLGLILGPTALILGILGWRYVRKHPEAKGTAHAIVGIVLGLFDILVNWGSVLFVLVMVGAAIWK
jgi:DNA-directed RNA polymerase subunit RPC12/RpoP